MNIIAISAAALTAAVFALLLRRTNSTAALLLTAACSVGLLLSLLGAASSVISTVNNIVAATGISTGYIAVLLKVIGICLLTEFTANTCRDAGSQSLASNVTLAGKLLVTVTALPLYTNILNTVLSILQR